ncbi:hypothetical protein, partial [Enterococcus faecalis]|uniref:hypothetical protein n=1 Tax=Enterococcus faecalis TaxID=1351 RepID=UPI001C8CE551
MTKKLLSTDVIIFSYMPSILLFLILLCQVIATPGFINPQENQMHAEKLFEQMKSIVERAGYPLLTSYKV